MFKKLQEIGKSFDNSEHYQAMALRWIVITVMILFTYMTAERFKVHIQCCALLPMYAQINYANTGTRFNINRYGINNYTERVEIELKGQLDPWGDPYMLEFYISGEYEVARMYSRHGGSAIQTIRIRK